jgi:hypothetical protein
LQGLRAEQTMPLPDATVFDVTAVAEQKKPLVGSLRIGLWSYGLALAASVLVAFVCGQYAASGRMDREFAAASSPANDNATIARSDAGQPVGADVRPGDYVRPKGSQQDGFLDNGSTDDASRLAPADWQTVRLDIDDPAAGESAAIDVPCLTVSGTDGDSATQAQIDPAWLAEQKSALTAQMLQTFHETGHAVTTEMQWWPFEMADGRRVILPVEQIEVRYVGHETY